MHTEGGGGLPQGRLSVSQILCDSFVRSLFGVFKDLHGYTSNGLWACTPRPKRALGATECLIQGEAQQTRRRGWGEPPPPLEGKKLQRRPQKRLDRRLQEVAKAVGGGYCRLQLPLKLAVRGTVARHRLGVFSDRFS